MDQILAYIKECLQAGNLFKRNQQWEEWLDVERTTNRYIRAYFGTNHPLFAISCLRVGDAYEANNNIEQSIDYLLNCYRYYQQNKRRHPFLQLSAIRLIRSYYKERDWDHLIFFFNKLKNENRLEPSIVRFILPYLTNLDPIAYGDTIESFYHLALTFIQNEEDRIDIYLNLGTFYFEVCRDEESYDYLEEAVRGYERITRDHSYLLAAYLLLFRLAYRMNRVKEYLHYYRKATAIAPNCATILRKGTLTDD